MSFVTVWRRISVVTFAFAFALFTVYNLEYPFSIIPEQVLFVAMVLMLIGYVKIPVIFLIEHWRAALDVRINSLGETLMTVLVPYSLAFIVLFVPTHEGASVEYGRLFSFTVLTVLESALQIFVVLFIASSIGPALRRIGVVS